MLLDRLKVHLFASLAVWGLVLTACVYDPDERCGPNQQYIGNDACSCSPGFILNDSGTCVACGKHETERNGSCECDDGYARATPTAACTPKPSGLGDACDDASPCNSAEFSDCHAVAGGDGYCTKACTSASDCSGGYRCQLSGDSGYCRRPATGYGDSCKTSEDCAGKEASFCETLQSHVCIVSCEAGADACFADEVCCDLSVFGGSLICVPDGKCPTQGGG